MLWVATVERVTLLVELSTDYNGPGTADDVSSGVQNLKLKNAEPVQVDVSPSLSLALNPF
jgi:hypothetical protein